MLKEHVSIPHDWAIKGPFDCANDRQYTRIVQDGEICDTVHNGRTGGLPHVGVGHYSCTIPGPAAPVRRVYLDFEGVMSRAKVWVNGKFAGSRNYGYSSFRIDAGRFLHADENKLEVSVENPDHSSRWYPGAGIFRPVYLVETDPVHFGHWTQIVRYLPESGTLRLCGIIENHTGSECRVLLLLTSPLFDEIRRDCVIPPDGFHFDYTVPLKPHRKWDIEDPVLYPVLFRIESGEFLDEETVTYGIRSFRFDKDHGFLLNDRRVKINGVCMHHDLGPIGAAFHRAAAKRQLEILREMGCNAIRTSHNPPAPEILDLCDEMGFLVMDEAFDVWHLPKIKNDYSVFFDQDSELDLSTMVCRDRNHPCVILWSIGNELMEIFQKDGSGAAIAHRLVSTIKRYDDERPVTAGLNACELAIENGMADELDIPAWNYCPQKYPFFHRRFPECPVLGSETLSTFSSRGIYYFPAYEYRYGYRAPRPEESELQCSSYCLDIPSWAMTPEAEFLAQDENEFVAGQFIWTGFDYLGEPSPYNADWPARSSYFGCVDLVGLPKDIFYLVQSQWVKHTPMIHIVPHHWNWKQGQKLDIHVFSNCDSVELFLNGKSLGTRELFSGSGILAERYRFIWHDIEWQNGELKAVGFRNNAPCVEDILWTAGPPAKLKLETNRTRCRADGGDMLFVTVSVTDQNNVFCATDTSFVRFYLTGSSLEIMAADAGNSTSTERFHLPECTLFSGMAVVYLKSTGIVGESVLHAESGSLEPATLTLFTEDGSENPDK